MRGALALNEAELFALYTVSPARVGPHNACVHRETLTGGQAFGHAARHHRLEHEPKGAAVAKAPVPVLGESRVIRHRILKP
jgi:hypothetical protein